MSNLEKALGLARGCYQRSVLTGEASLSGAELKGEARRWSSKYRVSRLNLISRLKANNIPFKVVGGTPKTGVSRLVVL